MHPHRSRPLRLALVGVVLTVATALRAVDPTDANTVQTKFSDPAKPGTLKVSFPCADIRITGTDRDEIVVTSSLEQKGKAEVDADGFRRLDEDVSFEVVEKNNTATIVMTGENPWAAQGSEFHIQVPRRTRLVLRTDTGGDIQVANIDGDIDINSVNGEVTLTDIGSSAIINTMNGEVTATFRQAPTKPVSITSMNGEVDVRLPADTKANLRLRTHNGSIRTNFPEGALVTKTEKVSGPVPPKGERLSAIAEEIRRRRDERHTDTPTAPEAPAPVAAPAPAPAPASAAAIAPLAPLATTERARADAELAHHAVEEAQHAANRAMAEAARSLARLSAHSPTFGKSITGTLNGGGVDIQLSTMNGTITLRQVK